MKKLGLNIRNIGRTSRIQSRFYGKAKTVYSEPRESKNLQLDPVLIRARIDQLSSEFKITKLEQWYLVKRSSHKDLDRLIRMTNMSLVELLRIAHPNHSWLAWKFPYVPHKYWSSIENQRIFMDWALKQLHPGKQETEFSDWYSVDKAELQAIGATRILNIYGDSITKALENLYPEHEFLPWKFRAAARHVWSERRNHRRFFQHLAKEQNWSETISDDWYRITTDLVAAAGGASLIAKHFANSVSSALIAAFPEHNWQPWRFDNCPKGFWDTLEHQQRFLLEWALPRTFARRHKVSETPITDRNTLMELMYTISYQELADQGGAGLYGKYNSIPRMAKAVFPDHTWEDSKFLIFQP